MAPETAMREHAEVILGTATPGMFVMRADSPRRSIVDLKGKPAAPAWRRSPGK